MTVRYVYVLPMKKKKSMSFAMTFLTSRLDQAGTKAFYHGLGFAATTATLVYFYASARHRSRWHMVFIVLPAARSGWPIAAPSRLADVREAPLQVGFHLMLPLEGSHRLAAADIRGGNSQ